MKLLILGGAGAMGAHASPELIASGRFDQIVIADVDLAKARQLAVIWGLTPEAATALDAADEAALRRLMAGQPAVVVNALPKAFTLNVARAAMATANLRVIDLSSLSPELRALEAEARAAGVTYVAGCGSSSGLTNMMAKHGARQMTEIESIEISFASFRSIALSPASIHGVFWEFGPDSVRGYVAGGEYKQVELWAEAKEIEFPQPYGRLTVYAVPHSEPRTLSRNLGARRVIVRGTFTPKVMRLMRTLVEYGFFAPGPVTINSTDLARRELIWQYLAQVPEANQEPVWGYALHVEVTGLVSGQRLRRTLWTTHPSSEQPGWSGSDAWAKCVALPLVAGSLLLAEGNYTGTGIDAPEAFLPAMPFLTELETRGLRVHEEIEELGER
ncbi:MAG TPA: saccharopine dehydrogenase NADP-binding domain-containing protein [Anaerolineae bacterium]|nr:saccharopine dehydrogenase NADP-binding domain-containing protein [Anaerolineae bacterium]HMR66253.1 saccharopine dehydrogenase NADP-binding domain-containing protein [Anaerolineae bacterium]